MWRQRCQHQLPGATWTELALSYFGILSDLLLRVDGRQYFRGESRNSWDFLQQRRRGKEY